VYETAELFSRIFADECRSKDQRRSTKISE
jgi:hypothetical protein